MISKRSKKGKVDKAGPICAQQLRRRGRQEQRLGRWQPRDNSPLIGVGERLRHQRGAIGVGMLLGPAEEDAPVWLVLPDELEESAGLGVVVLGVAVDNLWLDETGAWCAPYLVDRHPKRRGRAVFSGET